MEIRLHVCAEAVSIDQRQNTLSIFHVVEQWNVAAFPFLVQRVTVVTMFTRGPDEDITGRDVALVITEGERELMRGMLELNFQRQTTLRYVYDVRGIVVNQPGVLNFSIVIDGQVAASWPVAAIHVGRPVVQPELPIDPAQPQ